MKHVGCGQKQFILHLGPVWALKDCIPLVKMKHLELDAELGVISVHCNTKKVFPYEDRSPVLRTNESIYNKYVLKAHDVEPAIRPCLSPRRGPRKPAIPPRQTVSSLGKFVKQKAMGVSNQQQKIREHHSKPGAVDNYCCNGEN